jgi:hypothetical protein
MTRRGHSMTLWLLGDPPIEFSGRLLIELKLEGFLRGLRIYNFGNVTKRNFAKEYLENADRTWGSWVCRRKSWVGFFATARIEDQRACK